MRATTRLHLLTVLAAMAAVLAIPATAFAYAPSGGNFVTCVAGGDNNIECVAGLFDPGTEVDAEVRHRGAVVLDTTLTANSDGEVEFNFDVSDQNGAVTVRLVGTRDGKPNVVADQIAMVKNGEVIANAGFDATTLGGIALATLALGGGVLAFSRRKKSSMNA